MCRKVLCFCFVLIFSVVKADVIHEPNIVKINNMLVYQGVAYRIFKHIRAQHIEIINVKDKNVAIDETVKDATVVIENSVFMDEITKLYEKALASSEPYRFICASSDDDKVALFLDREKNIVVGIVGMNYIEIPSLSTPLTEATLTKSQVPFFMPYV